MRKICYEVNPSKLNNNDGFKNLSLAEKGIYHELVSIAWQSESQFKIPLQSNSLALKVGCSEEELVSLISKLESLNICHTELDFEFMTDFLVIRDLESQVLEFKGKKPCEIIDISSTIQSKKDSVSKRVVYGEKIEHPEIMYLKAEERDLSSFQGWMPTINFATSGQVYVLSAMLMSNLADEYPNINLRDQLIAIFDWFAKHGDRRQPVGKMSSFIYRWCDRASVTSATSDESVSSLLDQISLHL